MYGYNKISTLAALVAAARAQQACSLTPETHPPLNWETCTSSGCTSVNGAVTVDANWRWTHEVSGSTNCYTGNEWASICSDGATCAQECCLDGADYQGTYGASTSGNQLSLQFVTQGAYSKNVGSRMYLMASETKYQMFDLLGKEFTFDVDVSKLGCGLNGALYFVSMDEDGGMSKYPTNKAGAKYGTGYCDSQCPRDVKFIAGKANSEDWVPSSSDPNAGTGSMGACCSEMDVWEANKMSSAYTPHPCKTIGYAPCDGDSCGGTYSSERYGANCDPDGCDFNSYRMGNTTFYGPGKTIDTTKKVTVVTQFIKGSDGSLSDIKRFYVQDGVTYANSESAISGVEGNSITEDFCTAQKSAFGDEDVFKQKGGLAQMGAALEKGMVLVMSLWDDHYANMLWLDSTYPTNSTAPGAARGACSTSSGKPSDVESTEASSTVVFSNIKFGDIGTTFSLGSSESSGSSSAASPSAPATQAPTPATSEPAATTSASSGSSGTASKYSQCGGSGWTGPTVCADGSTCKVMNPYYSQCL
ncbi:hypothetical protein TD95_001762 [Thielaviopsis punctulata]|uniref:Glucanase n=1 Tax=Thielaviopsis punctulata TaxID=72032 RepID=A0A0F4Z7J1_9PEZI|nr:hypothetical protein TD95_001762 [Thielaviopsis punctulata]